MKIVGAAQLTPIHRQEVFPGCHVDTRLREWGPEFRVPVLTIEDPSEPVAPPFNRVVRTQQPTFHFLDFGDVTTTNEQMPHRHVAKHLFEQIVQIAAAGDTFQIRGVLFFSPVEVEPVVSGVVEKVALQPPCLVVHLLPLRTRVHVDLESVKLQGALRLLRRRRRARAGLRHWRDGRDEPLLALPEQHLLTVVRNVKRLDAFEDFVRLARGQVEPLHCYRRRTFETNRVDLRTFQQE